MKKLTTLLTVLSLSVFAIGTIGCENGNDLEQTGEQIQEGFEEAGEQTEEAVDDTTTE